MLSAPDGAVNTLYPHHFQKQLPYFERAFVVVDA
jgi:hypothetical protein